MHVRQACFPRFLRIMLKERVQEGIGSEEGQPFSCQCVVKRSMIPVGLNVRIKFLHAGMNMQADSVLCMMEVVRQPISEHWMLEVGMCGDGRGGVA